MSSRVVLSIGALMIVAGGVAAACTSTDTDDLEARIEALEAQAGGSEQIAALQEEIARAQMIAALDILDNAGLHAIDEAANEEGSLEGVSSGAVRGALLAVTAAQWPPELEADAAAMVTALQELLTALDSADVDIVGPPAAVAHDTQHDFSEQARNLLAAAVGLEVEEHEEHQEAEGGSE